jgi:hypothetical protein
MISRLCVGLSVLLTLIAGPIPAKPKKAVSPSKKPSVSIKTVQPEVYEVYEDPPAFASIPKVHRAEVTKAWARYLKTRREAIGAQIKAAEKRPPTPAKLPRVRLDTSEKLARLEAGNIPTQVIRTADLEVVKLGMDLTTSVRHIIQTPRYFIVYYEPRHEEDEWVIGSEVRLVLQKKPLKVVERALWHSLPFSPDRDTPL